MPALTTLAPAKVNLFLHVGPLAADGYHPLSSLVAFADIGDRVSARPAEALALTLDGPFAGLIAGEPDNLVLRAVRALAGRRGLEPRLAFDLDKRLPVAAGLGGGSSDAGAALRLARDLLTPDLDDAALTELAAAIGADGPMCLFARPAWAEGRGDVLTPEPRLPPLPAVLVNPRVLAPTGAVYRAYDAGPPRTANRPEDPVDWSVVGLIDWLRPLRNDLELPAVALAPDIGAALAAVAAAPGIALSRMSGSGATVFGLCADSDAAHAAAARLAADHPDWWIQPTLLGDPLA